MHPHANRSVISSTSAADDSFGSAARCSRASATTSAVACARLADRGVPGPARPARRHERALGCVDDGRENPRTQPAARPTRRQPAPDEPSLTSPAPDPARPGLRASRTARRLPSPPAVQAARLAQRPLLRILTSSRHHSPLSNVKAILPPLSGRMNSTIKIPMIQHICRISCPPSPDARGIIALTSPAKLLDSYRFAGARQSSSTRSASATSPRHGTRSGRPPAQRTDQRPPRQSNPSGASAARRAHRRTTAILTPRLTHSHEHRLAAAPRMERDAYTHRSLRNRPIKRSRQRRRRAARRRR